MEHTRECQMLYGVQSNIVDQLIVIINSIYSLTLYNTFPQLNTAKRIFHAVMLLISVACEFLLDRK